MRHSKHFLPSSTDQIDYLEAAEDLRTLGLHRQISREHTLLRFETFSQHLECHLLSSQPEDGTAHGTELQQDIS